MKNEWLLYVLLAGLSWGTYVPLISYGGSQLGKPPGSRLMAILCVGIAYFVLGVAIPMAMFLSKQTEWPTVKTTGIVFSSMAGVAGAVGALCVIFATGAATAKARAEGLDPTSYKLYIAPLIFGLAPVINTVVSSFWHPGTDRPFHVELPGWKLWVGIVLIGVGAALVLFSKEEVESKPHAPPTSSALESRP
jgi:drug/metabolite transporter (DMT)-like permease